MALALTTRGYRWIKGNVSYATTFIPMLVITNVQASASLRVAVTNAALPTGVFSPAAGSVSLTMIPDADGDGLPDAWELAYFGNTTNAVATADADGDGLSNRDEYLAGTDPTNALSVLKIVLTTTNANVLRFVAQSNLSYTVQRRTNLIAPAWSSLTGITALPTVRTVLVNTVPAPSGTERYYRITTP